MAQRAPLWISPEAYLAREIEADERSEYVDGAVYAMAGSSLNHSRLVHGLSGALINALDGSGCESFGSETKLGIEAANAYFYPDAMVVCGEVEVESEANGIVKNPTSFSRSSPRERADTTKDGSSSTTSPSPACGNTSCLPRIASSPSGTSARMTGVGATPPTSATFRCPSARSESRSISRGFALA